MKKQIRSNIFTGIMLVVAGIVNATGVALFLLPSSVIDGGISGLSLFLSHITNLSASIFIVAINLPFFILGFKRMGKAFIFKSLIAILVYSLMTFTYTYFKVDTMVYESLGKDIFLCAIFGGLISGIGSGLTIKCGGAIDGIEVTAVIFSKKLGITVGQFVMVFNAIMYLTASLVKGDFRIGLYSIVSYAVGLKAVDFVVEGFDKCKAVFVITSKGDLMAEAISNVMGRGITILDAEGYYSNENKTMMYCVVNRFEIAGLKKLIKGVDENAFVTINEISDIMGSEIKRQSVFKRKQKVEKQLENIKDNN